MRAEDAEFSTLGASGPTMKATFVLRLALLIGMLPTGGRAQSSREAPASAETHYRKGLALARGRHAYFRPAGDRKSTRLNSSHSQISYAVFCLKKKKKKKSTN